MGGLRGTTHWIYPLPFWLKICAVLNLNNLDHLQHVLQTRAVLYQSLFRELPACAKAAVLPQAH